MTWKSIHLELARTPEFPEGSAVHAYFLRLPLDDAGFIDRAAMEHPVESPRVRRMWPNEHDRNGVVIKPGDADDEGIFHLEHHPIRVGEYLTITEADGAKLPFKIVSCHS
jgi:hypothetical protein